MIGWEYPPFKAGGLATHCYGLTHSLADKGVKIDFYDRPDSKEIAGHFYEAVYKYNDLVVTKVLNNINRHGKYNAIHCHDWLTMTAGTVLKEKTGIPLVVTVHSTEYDRSGWLNPNQWFIDIERNGMEHANRIIAVSHFTKRIIVEKYGVPADKITVIHNAVYPVPEGHKKDIVLFLGRLTIQKGAEFFLRAAQKVKDFEPDARFVVAGSGDMLPRLITQAIDLGLSDKVIFTGRLSDEEVKHLYGISSVYVMPSVSEPFGITALEAISAGTPTIASKTAGFSEVFNNCLKVDFWDTDEMANKIISLLRYDPLRKTMAVEGKREIKLFTWDRVADKTIEVYRSVN